MAFDPNAPKGAANVSHEQRREASKAAGNWVTTGNNADAKWLMESDPIFSNLDQGEALARRDKDFGLGSNNNAQTQQMLDAANSTGGRYSSLFDSQATAAHDQAQAAEKRGTAMYGGDTGQYDQNLEAAVRGVGRQEDSYDALNRFAGTGGQAGQQSQLNALNNFAATGPGASAAQAQLTQATDANTQNALALARSGRGMGGSQAAMRQALSQNAGTQQQSAAQMAELRANENTAYQAQRLNALNAAGGLSSTMDSQRLQALTGAGALAGQAVGASQANSQLGLAGAQYATDTKLKGTQLNDASAQNWATQQANATQQGLGAEMGAQTQGLNINSTALAGRENEYASANSTYATSKGLAQAAAIADANRQQAYTGAALSTAGTVLGTLSDERAKKNVIPLSTWGTGDDGLDPNFDPVTGTFGKGLASAGAALQGKKTETAPSKNKIKDPERGHFDPIAQGSDYTRGEPSRYTFGNTSGLAEYFAPSQRTNGPHTSINPANNPFLTSDERSKQEISPLGGVAPLSAPTPAANGSVAGSANNGPTLAQQQDEASKAKGGQIGGAAGGAVGGAAGGAIGGPIGAVAGSMAGKMIGGALGKVFSDVRGKEQIVPLAKENGAAGIAESPSAVEQYAKASPKALGKFSRSDHPILSEGDAMLAQSARSIPGSSYEYKDPYAPGAKPGRQVGPMAQDLAANPLTRGTVVKDRNGRLAVDAPRLTLYNTAQQHATQNQIDALEAKTNELASMLQRKPGDANATNFARSTGGL